LTKANTSSTIRIPAICSLSEHETSRALGDTVHQDPPAAGRRCTRSSQFRGACARQLRPADRWPSFHRARRQRSSLSAVRGPVEALRCIRQGVYFPANFQIKCDRRFQIKCDCIGIGNIIGLTELGAQREPFGSFRRPSQQARGSTNPAGNSIRLCPVLVVRIRDRPRNTLARFTLQMESSIPTSNQASRKSLTAP
jgi:hypothetical protein